MIDPKEPSHLTDRIAVIGVAGRFPGSDGVEELWEALCQGRETVSFFTPQELQAAGVQTSLVEDPRYVWAHGAVPGVDLFDAGFFGYTPREATLMDPQHRLLLECSWHALEDAGYEPGSYQGRIGVFAGARKNTYLPEILTPAGADQAPEDALLVRLANDRDFLTSRISYLLGLTGPSVVAQTACSTSLTAVHLACQSLLAFECDLALAGGAAVTVPQVRGYLFQEGGIGSPDGHCRAFDENAQGCCPANGVGLVVLRRLEDALEDRDHIYAVILGSALSNDGAHRVGFTAPGVEGQAGAITQALTQAHVDPRTIEYVEAHGTGTRLGDPIEIDALSQAFRQWTRDTGYCAIGSLKSNLGHMDAAAGVGGLIKTVLCLKHGLIPQTLHCERPNPALRLESGPFFVAQKPIPWPRQSTPRRAGVSSFGMGGGNVHVVLEEAPDYPCADESHSLLVLPLSARTETALDALGNRLAAHLAHHSDLHAPDVAFTLQVGRKPFLHRRVLFARDLADTVAQLRKGSSVDSGACARGETPVIFMLPGQGAQYPGMTRELYETEATFRAELDRCAELLEDHLHLDLRKVLFPARDDAGTAARRLQETAISQPAVFAVEYALAQLWLEWGIRPAALLGHSVGEITASCLAGIMPLEEGLELVTARGRVIQALPRGAMVSMHAPEATLRKILPSTVTIAASNGPDLWTVSGPLEGIDELEALASRSQIAFVRLRTSHAFHSPMMDPAVPEMLRILHGMELRRPTTPVLSTVTGDWIRDREATDPGYWAEQIRRPVRFGDALAKGATLDHGVFLEVGPGTGLSQLARRNLGRVRRGSVLSSLPAPTSDEVDSEHMIRSLGALWLRGATFEWHGFHRHHSRRRVPLPGYPFERQRYWPETCGPALHTPTPGGGAEKRLPLGSWFSVRSWAEQALSDGTAGNGLPPGPVLIFADNAGLGDTLAGRFERIGRPVTTVIPGDAWDHPDNRRACIRPGHTEDYHRLVRRLRQRGLMPSTVIHLWSVSQDPIARDSSEASQELGFVSVVYLTQALTEASSITPIRMVLVASGVHMVKPDDPLSPSKSTLMGACTVIPQEYPALTARLVDIPFPQEHGDLVQSAETLWQEIIGDGSGCCCAHRNGRRWVERLEPVAGGSEESGALRLRENGVYLITGGFGGIGLTLARGLAQSVRARLALVGRTPLPEPERWTALESPDDRVSRRILALRQLQELGADAIPFTADVSDPVQMARVIEEIVKRWGTIHGVVHSAGVPGGTLTALLPRPAIDALFAPKIRGTQILDELTEEMGLDFFVLCSSLGALIGGAGNAHYAAGNAYQDAFAAERARRTGQRTISIAWDTWQQVGMAAEAEMPTDQRHDHEAALQYGIQPAEGWPAFLRCLDDPAPHLLVSTRPLHARRATPQTAQQAVISPRAPQSTGSAGIVVPRTPAADEEAPADELEHRIMAVWSDVLGVQDLTLDSDFFELGGHSLLGLRLVQGLEESLGFTLPLSALTRFSTVEKMAAAIREGDKRRQAQGWGQNWPEAPSRLSDDERRALLAVLAGTDLPATGPLSFTRALNSEGYSEPLFWCFNAPGLEPRRLSGRLGQDQPLYVLFSGVDVLDWKEEGTAARVADPYLEELLAVRPEGPIRLGGNCAGGQVACALAFRLLEMGREVERLCLLECFDPRLFEFTNRLLLLFGEESSFRVQDKLGWPKPGWEKGFQRLPEVDWTPGAHGEFFDEPNVRVLGDRVRRFLHGNPTKPAS